MVALGKRLQNNTGTGQEKGLEPQRPFGITGVGTEVVVEGGSTFFGKREFKSGGAGGTRCEHHKV